MGLFFENKEKAPAAEIGGRVVVGPFKMSILFISRKDRWGCVCFPEITKDFVKKILKFLYLLRENEMRRGGGTKQGEGAQGGPSSFPYSSHHHHRPSPSFPICASPSPPSTQKKKRFLSVPPPSTRRGNRGGGAPLSM